MRNQFLIAMTAALLAAGASTEALADTCHGNCGSLNAADGNVSTPPSGSQYSYVSSFEGLNGAGEIAGVGGTDGSDLTTVAFSAKAGDALDFYFNYITADGTSSFPDYGFSELLDGSGNHAAYLFTARTVAGPGDTSPGFGLPANDSTLIPATTPITPGATVFSPLGTSSGVCFGGLGNGCGNTGWIESTYKISTAGNYSVRFGVTNFGDESVDSALAFAGITVGGTPVPTGAVPETGTWFMMILGFGAIGGMMRRLHRKSEERFTSKVRSIATA